MIGTLDEFASLGGALTYTDNLASSLGVDPSQVQIVSISEGSVIIVSDIVVSEDQSIDELRSLVTTALESEDGLNLGLPVSSITTIEP